MCYEDSTFFRKTKKTMLMFRKYDKKAAGYEQLELRHQRTGDVVFDWKENGARLYVYRLIETLLPKSALFSQNPKKEDFKLLELFSSHQEYKEPETVEKQVFKISKEGESETLINS